MCKKIKIATCHHKTQAMKSQRGKHLFHMRENKCSRVRCHLNKVLKQLQNLEM